MKKIILLSLPFIIILPLFFSCEGSTEDEDKEKPTVRIDSVSSVMYFDSSGVNFFKATFFDNKGLSSYKIKIIPGSSFPDPEEAVPGYGGDSMAIQNFTPEQRLDIFGSQEITVEQYFTIPYKFRKYEPGTANSKEYTARTGLYNIVIAFVDRAGNADSLISKEVTILYPKRFYQQPEEPEPEDPEE